MAEPLRCRGCGDPTACYWRPDWRYGEPEPPKVLLCGECLVALHQRPELLELLTRDGGRA